MSKVLPAFAKDWMRQWRNAAVALEEVKRNELQALTESDSARIFVGLCRNVKFPERATSGLVEQQRIFARHWKPKAQ
jgi:hypothetical protein